MEGISVKQVLHQNVERLKQALRTIEVFAHNAAEEASTASPAKVRSDFKIIEHTAAAVLSEAEQKERPDDDRS
jgi:hypothetical protein